MAFESEYWPALNLLQSYRSNLRDSDGQMLTAQRLGALPHQAIHESNTAIMLSYMAIGLYLEHIDQELAELTEPVMKEAIKTPNPPGLNKQERLGKLLDVASRCAEELYGQDRVDAVPWDANDKDCRYLIIYYPEVQISDGSTTHLIKKLYVSVKFICEVNSPKATLITAISGIRGEVDQYESAYKHGYIHSHMLSGSHEWSKACLGLTDLADALAELALRFSELGPDALEDQMMAMLFSLESFLAVESIEGVPYLYISKLRKDYVNHVNSHSISNSQLSDIVDLFFEEVKNQWKDPQMNLGDLINGVLIGRISSSLILTTNQFGDIIVDSGLHINPENHVIETECDFKKKMIVTEIVPVFDTTDQSRYTKIVHPQIVNAVKTKLDNEITTQLLPCWRETKKAACAELRSQRRRAAYFRSFMEKNYDPL
jgi:hypothetical protein